MANHKSALKKAKQDEQRRLRNRSGRSRLRTELKKYRAVLGDNAQDASAMLPGMIRLIDKSAKRGLIHANAANRLKSKLTIQTNKAASA